MPHVETFRSVSSEGVPACLRAEYGVHGLTRNEGYPGSRA
jgi:hypothetical protein